VTARWEVIEGDDEFFVITKRIDYFLHESRGDGRALGASETPPICPRWNAGLTRWTAS
jgi:hypothetical protein